MQVPGKHQVEPCETSGLAVDVGVPLMQMHDRLDDGQPQPGAAFGAGAAAVGAVKPFEQVRQVLRFNAPAGVAHRQRDVLVVGFHQQQHTGATGRMANRVGQQVGNGTLDHQAITLHPGVAAQIEGHLLVLGTQGKQRHYPLCFFTQRHRSEPGPRRRMADLGQKQHVGNDARQALHFLRTGFQPGLVLLQGTFARQGHLGLAHQVGQWRTQFVGQVIGELRQLLHPRIQALEHHVEALGQLGQFLGQVIHGQAMGQVLGGHLRRHLAELFQRRQATLYQPPGADADQDQQQRHGDDRGAQVGAQQCVIVGAVQRQQHSHRLAAAQGHQVRGAEDAIAAAVRPVQVSQGCAGGGVAQQRLLRFGTDAEQHRCVGLDAGDGQVNIVVAHHQVQQRMGAGGDVEGREVLAQAVLQLLQFVLQALARQILQLVGQGQVRQGGQQQHQPGAHQADRQAQAHRQAAGLH
ncbi:hypothetical protein PFWH6_0707 [Pseudomonas fluorescens WH6]|nr:hypothetical protein PFWH6_0707 [Pseudomonas fluorescens WH6]